MKKLRLIVLFALSSCAAASALPQSQHWETGFSDQYKTENTLGEYSFGYNEDHTTGGSFRRETGDHMGNKFGSYGLRIGDGRVRIVNYVADQDGFRADVVSNEPGVESQNSNLHSKISKKSIFSVIIPGFRYSPAIPYVNFERYNDMRDSHEGMPREMMPELTKDERNFEEDYDHPYPNQDIQEENLDNYFGDGAENFDGVYSQEYPDLESNYMPESQMLDDSFLDGEFSHDSETVIRNQTENVPVEQTASEISSTKDTDIVDSTSTVAPETMKSFSSNHELNFENKYGSTTNGKDEYPLYSNVILSKSKDQESSTELMNATVSESNVDIQKNNTNSSESMA